MRYSFVATGSPLGPRAHRARPSYIVFSDHTCSTNVWDTPQTVGSHLGCFLIEPIGHVGPWSTQGPCLASRPLRFTSRTCCLDYVSDFFRLYLGLCWLAYGPRGPLAHEGSSGSMTTHGLVFMAVGSYKSLMSTDSRPFELGLSSAVAGRRPLKRGWVQSATGHKPTELHILCRFVRQVCSSDHAFG